MKCQKCGFQIEVENYTDLIRIEQHHLHPKSLGNPKGLGQLIDLCRNCHIEKLHPLILKIAQKHSIQFKKLNSLHWTWKYILPSKRHECIEEIKKFTIGWVTEDDTKTTMG